MMVIISSICIVTGIAMVAGSLSYTLRKRRRSFRQTVNESMNPLRAFATAYLLDSAALGLTFLTALATFVASFVAFLTHRSKSTTVTAVMALTNLLTSATALLDLSANDLQELAQSMVGDFTSTPMREDSAVYESVGQLAMTIAIALAGSYGTRKSMGEILAAWPTNLGRAKGSTKAIWESIKEVYFAFHPNMTEVENLDTVAKNVKRLTDLAGIVTRTFITRKIQQEIKDLITKTDEMCRLLPRSDASEHLKKRFAAEHARIVTRQTEQRAVIELSSQVRRLPVYFSFRGPPGHGKSWTLNELHKDLSKWMIEEGHLDRPMDILIGTGGGDDYLPPVGNEEWYIVDEYLASWDEKWVSVMNKIISDNPVTLSSAFIKHAEPHPHFVVSSSNIDLPFEFPKASKNYMREEVLEAFHSRHQWIHYWKPTYNKKLGRHHPWNAKQRYEMRYEKVIDGVLHSEPISYDELLTKMKKQWVASNKKYNRALENIMTMPDISVDVQGATQPTVIGLFGASGMGKTTHIDERIVPILEATRNIHKVTNLNMDILPGPHVYIVDDMLSTDSRNFEKYRKFYERCSSDDVIIVADNLKFPKGHFESYIPALVEYVVGVWFGTNIFSWAKLWEPRRTLYDVSQLGHESYIRRLGFSEAVFNGHLVSTATGGNNTAWIAELGGFFNSSSLRAVSDGEIMEIAADCLRGSYRNLEKVERVDHDGPWDIDVKIDKPEDVMKILACPTDDCYVRVSSVLVAAFPDYQTILGQITNELESDLIYEALARAYRRKAFTARLIAGSRNVRVAKGKISGLGTTTEITMTFEDTPGGALVRWAGPDIIIPWPDYFARTPDLPDMSPAQIRSFTLARRNFDEVPAVTARRTEFQIAQRRAKIEMGLVSKWQDMYKKMQDHKTLCFVIAALTAAVGAGGAIWMYLRAIKSDDEDSVENRLPQIAEMACDMVPESYEPIEKANHLAKAVVRKRAANKLNTESYEDGDKAAHRAVKIVQRKRALKSEPAKMEMVDLTDKPSGLSMHVETAMKRTNENFVWLTNGRVSLYGIAYQGRRIICPHHILFGGSEETTVEFVRTDGPCKYMAKTLVQYPSRDMAIIEITDKTCPSFKDIRKFFAKEKDLLLHHTALHFLPKGQTLIAKNVSFQYRMKTTLTDTGGSPWSPQDRIYYAESWTTPKLTVAGDCGTPLLAQQAKFENRTIIGMHIAARSAHTSYAASICQEDFDLPEAETATPEAVDDVVMEIHGIDFVEPRRPILNFDKLETGGYTGIEDSDRLKFVGFSAELFSPSWTRGGDLKPSRISDKLTIENDQGPAPVSNRDPRIDPEALKAMPKDRSGQPSLGAAQLAHISGTHTKLDKEVYDKSVTTLVDMWLRLPGIRDWRPLTPEETLNGIHDGKYGGFLGPIRGDTSPGLPWKKRGAHQKSHLLKSRNDPGEPIRWDFQESGLGREMLQCYTDTLASWRENMQYMRVIDCNLKVECLPKKKVKAGNCRMFLAESMDAFLAQRTVCGFLQILAMKTRWMRHQHHTTGLNPYKEFQEMYKRLKRISDMGFDGDYSKFDKKIPVWAWDILEEVLIEVAGQCEFGRRPGYDNTLRQFVRSLRTKLYVFEGNIYLSDGDQASGVYPTNIGDSWLNDILVLVAVTFTALQHEKEAEWRKVMKAGVVDAEALAEKVDWLTHGDDIAFSVHEDLQPTFNFETYRDFLAQHGVKLTLPSKTDDSATLIPIEDISFIGRTFEFDGEGCVRPHGKLRRTAICRMAHWTRDGSWESLAENLDAAGRELRAYPAEEYDEIRYDIEIVTHDMGYPFIFPTHRLARLDLIQERDEIPLALALASELHGDPVKTVPCLADGSEPCEVQGKTRFAGPGLQERNDLPLTWIGRSADQSSACQAPATAGTTLEKGRQYQSCIQRRIPDTTDHNCQGLEDDSPIEQLTTPRRVQNDQGENRTRTLTMGDHQTSKTTQTETTYEKEGSDHQLSQHVPSDEVIQFFIAYGKMTDAEKKQYHLSTAAGTTATALGWPTEGKESQEEPICKVTSVNFATNLHNHTLPYQHYQAWPVDVLVSKCTADDSDDSEILDDATERLATFVGTPVDLSNQDFGEPTPPETPDDLNQSLDNYVLFCPDHEHKGLERGKRIKHHHPCDNCRRVFTHEHTIKTKYESLSYPQLCPPCFKTNWQVDMKYVELVDKIKLTEEVHVLEKPWPKDVSSKMDLPHPDVPGATLKASVARAKTMYHGHPPPSIPPALYYPFQCGACATHVNGAIALYKHAANSHSHLKSINYWPIPPMQLTCGEQQIELHGPTAVRVKQQMARTMTRATTESAEAGDSLSSIQGGVDPAAGAALNAAEQPAAIAATGGLDVAVATPGMVSGTVLPSESSIALVGPAIPPTMGASTGAQFASYEVDRSAYEMISDSNVTASTSLAGTQVASLSWGEFGPQMSKRLSENKFFSGSTEMQIQFYGTSNTSGALLVYQVEDEDDVYESLTEMLRRPHFLISAAAGTTTHSINIHQADDVLKTRRTDNIKDGMVPQIRLVVYSKLLNTFGTDVQVNLKVLSRPGPDFRMWGPKPPGQVESKIRTQVMPYRNYIVFDRLGGVGHLNPVEEIIESQIGRKSYQRGIQELPNSSYLEGVNDVDDRQQYTGVVNPLMNSSNYDGPNDFTEFGGVLSSEANYITTMDAAVANKNILKSVGSLFNYGAVGNFNLSHENPDTGFVGYVDSSDYDGVTSATCFESRKRLLHHFETYTFATADDREAAREKAIWRDRARTATVGFSTSYYPEIAAPMGAVCAKNHSPALVSDDLTTFNINGWEDDEWYEPLKKMHEDQGTSSWVLRIGEVNYGRLGLYKIDNNICLFGQNSYGSINTNGEQIVFHSPMKWNVNNALEFDETKITSLVVAVNKEIRQNRKAILDAKPEWRSYKVRWGSSKNDLMVAYLQAAVAGGLLSGLGSGLAQHAQNKWWDKEFEKNRNHEKQMMEMKAGFMSQGMDKKADYAGKAMDKKAQYAGKAMDKKAEYAGKAIDKKMDFANDQRAYDQKTNALQMGQNASKAGLNHVSEKKPVVPQPTGLNATDKQPQPNGLNAQDLNPQSKGLNAQDMAPKGPTQHPPGYNGGGQQQIMGANNTNPEMYHPANMMQGQDLANPAQVSNAVNPYTESQKRVSSF